GQPAMVLAKMEALARGCLEAILVNPLGGLGGCLEGSISIVRQGVVRSVLFLPLDAACYTLEDILKAESVPKSPDVEIHAAPETLYAADELILAGTSCGIIGIVQVDGKAIGSGREGPVTRRIREAYRRLTRCSA